MTDQSQKANLPGPGETEGGLLDPSGIPEEARQEPALRTPKGDQDTTTTGPKESNEPPSPVTRRDPDEPEADSPLASG